MNKMEDKDKDKKKKKVFKLVLGDDEMVTGVNKISLVEQPAHESNFMTFSKEKEMDTTYKFEETKEKMLVTGAALIPNKEIKRKNEKTGEIYYVYFDEETIEKAQELYFKRSQHNSSNINHIYDVDDVVTVESWIINDPKNDKANSLGFENLPKGTWMISDKIGSKELFEEIKNGDSLNGFSIEGQFVEEMMEMSIMVDEKNTYQEITEILNSDIDDKEKFEKIQNKLK